MPALQTAQNQAEQTPAPVESTQTAQQNPLEQQAEGANYDEGKQILSPDGKPTDKKTADKEQAEQRKKNFEAKLSQMLGGPLFDLIHEHLSVDALNGYAKEGIGELVGAAKSIKPGADGKVAGVFEPEAAQKLAELVLQWASEKAGGWLESDKGQAFLAKISNFAEEHPLIMAGSAISAAIVAAVVLVGQDYNPDAFATEFGLGKDVKLSAGLDIGKLQSLCLEGANLGLKVQKGRISGSIGASWKQTEKDGQKTNTIGVEGGIAIKGDQEGEQHKLDAKAQFNDQRSAGGSLSHTYTGGKQGKEQASVTTTASVDKNAETNTRSAGLSVEGKGVKGGNAAAASGSFNANYSENTQTGDKKAGVQGSYTGAQVSADAKPFSIAGEANAVTKDGDLMIDAKGMVEKGGVRLDAMTGGKSPAERISEAKLTIDGGDGQSTSLQGKYLHKEGKFALGLGQSLQQGGLKLDQYAGTDGQSLEGSYDGGGGVGGSFGVKQDEAGTTGHAGASMQSGGWTISSAAELNLDDNQLTSLQGKLGYEDKSKVNSFLLEYSREWAQKNGERASKDTFKAALHTSIAGLTVGAKAGASLQDGKLDKGNLSFSAGNDAFKAALDLEMSRNAAGGFDSKAGLSLASGKSFNGLNLEVGRQFDEQAGRYKTNVGAMGETQLGKLGLRGQLSASTFDGQQWDTKAEGLGAYPIGGNKKILGGMRYENVNSQQSVTALAGMQIGSVPIVMGYNPSKQEVSVGVTMSFDKISSLFK